MTTGPRQRAALCVLRIEARGDRLLITVTTSHDLDRRLYAARAGSTRRTTDVEVAVAATDEFLRAFTAGPPSHGVRDVTVR